LRLDLIGVTESEHVADLVGGDRCQRVALCARDADGVRAHVDGKNNTRTRNHAMVSRKTAASHADDAEQHHDAARHYEHRIADGVGEARQCRTGHVVRMPARRRAIFYGRRCVVAFQTGDGQRRRAHVIIIHAKCDDTVISG
tara:strand:+ start:2394 stop:2819 length:426 start_codon:yes stop_codon:yes gene_type:complete